MPNLTFYGPTQYDTLIAMYRSDILPVVRSISGRAYYSLVLTISATLLPFLAQKLILRLQAQVWLYYWMAYCVLIGLSLTESIITTVFVAYIPPVPPIRDEADLLYHIEEQNVQLFYTTDAYANLFLGSLDSFLT